MAHDGSRPVPTDDDLNVIVTVEFFYIFNRIPVKVPSMPPQHRTVGETQSVMDIRQWVWARGGIVERILKKNNCDQIKDIITSTYDSKKDEKLLHFILNSPPYRKVWWDRDHLNVFPKHEHQTWDAPTMFILVGPGLDSGTDILELSRWALPVYLYVKRYQEEIVIRRRFFQLWPLIDEYVARLEPIYASPFQSPPLSLSSLGLEESDPSMTESDEIIRPQTPTQIAHETLGSLVYEL